MEAMVAARSHMIATLNTFRGALKIGGLGVTDSAPAWRYLMR